MKILLFEHGTSATGHRLPYGRLIVDAMVEADCEPIVCFPEVVTQTPQFTAYFPSTAGFPLEGFRIKTGLKPLAHFKACLSELDRLTREHRPDYIVLPTADGLAPLLSFQRSLGRLKQLKNIPIDILLMKSLVRPDDPTIKQTVRQWFESFLIQRNQWHRIFHLDPKIATELSVPWHAKIQLCPDPVPRRPELSRQAARKKLGISESGRVIASIGNQNKSKGVDRLIKAFCHSRFDTECRLLLAGPFSDDVRQLQSTLSREQSDSITAIDRFLTEEEFESAIIAADLVAVPYRMAQRPSGVCSRAVAWGRPLIGSNLGWIKWACETLSAGDAVDTSLIDEFSAALQVAVDKADAFQQSPAAWQYSKFHTADNFRETWMVGFREYQRRGTSVQAAPLGLNGNQ